MLVHAGGCFSSFEGAREISVLYLVLQFDYSKYESDTDASKTQSCHHIKMNPLYFIFTIKGYKR